MRLTILSDSHDNIPNLLKALKWINEEGIKTIIHCGDLCAAAILSRVIIPNFKGEIHLIHGNVGDPDKLEELVKNYSNVTIHGLVGEITLDNIKIAFTHFPQKAKELAQTGKYDYVFYGHTHQPWEEKSKINPPAGGQKSKITRMVNPGTLAGMFYKATFAVLDTKTNKLELKILEKI